MGPLEAPGNNGWAPPAHSHMCGCVTTPSLNHSEVAEVWFVCMFLLFVAFLPDNPDKKGLYVAFGVVGLAVVLIIMVVVLLECERWAGVLLPNSIQPFPCCLTNSLCDTSINNTFSYIQFVWTSHDFVKQLLFFFKGSRWSSFQFFLTQPKSSKTSSTNMMAMLRQDFFLWVMNRCSNRTVWIYIVC